MRLKKRLLKKSRLYVIIDSKIAPDTALGRIAKKLRSSPVDIIQLRDKHAKKGCLLKEALQLRRIFLNSRKLFLVNDYPDIAKICGADGVHLGQRDLPVEAARRILGKRSIIGKSCHNLKQAIEAEKEGADYIGMGPLFATRSKEIRRKRLKPELIRKVSKRLNIPVFAIGGITTDNLEQVLKFAIKKIAVCGAILRAKNIALTAKSFFRQLAS
ncbi:MAG: thiamine phosphate synthase [Candidatus Omnitrophota bacterium]|nr:thiamine phosphate synthase [Candidatus Omnitrophota bacterium]